MFLLLTVVFSTDLLRLVAGGVGRRVARGAAIRRSRGGPCWPALTAAATGLLVGGLAAVALRSVAQPVEVRQVRVAARPPPAASRTDSGSCSSPTSTSARRSAARSSRRSWRAPTRSTPDLIAITGDLVDGAVGDLAPAIAPLANLRAPPRRLLRDRQSRILLGRGCLADRAQSTRYSRIAQRTGVDWQWRSRIRSGGGGRSLRRSLRGSRARRSAGARPRRSRSRARAGPAGAPTAHAARRRAVRRRAAALRPHARGPDVAVQLRGPAAAAVRGRAPPPGRAQIYVSRGTGYWGPPMRLGAPAEITEIRLLSGRPGDAPA